MCFNTSGYLIDLLSKSIPFGTWERDKMPPLMCCVYSGQVRLGLQKSKYYKHKNKHNHIHSISQSRNNINSL